MKNFFHRFERVDVIILSFKSFLITTREGLKGAFLSSICHDNILLINHTTDCTGERDHLIFYDGSSTNDPVLAKFCGGDWLPKVVSR